MGKRGKHAEAAKRLAQQIQEIRNRAKFVPRAKPAGAAAKAEEKAAETVGKAEKAAETVVKAEEKAGETIVKMEGKAAETVVKAEAKAGARLASRAGRLALSALLPGPEDAIMLMYEFAGSYKEAWEWFRTALHAPQGITMGIAAGMLGLDFNWVKTNLWRRYVSADVATQVIGAVGKAERAYNDGLERGHRYGAGHPRSLKNRILGETFAVLAAEGYQTDEEQLFTLDTVARVAHVLTPIADDFLRQAAERKTARERREAKELKESGCVGFKCSGRRLGLGEMAVRRAQTVVGRQRDVLGPPSVPGQKHVEAPRWVRTSRQAVALLSKAALIARAAVPDTVHLSRELDRQPRRRLGATPLPRPGQVRGHHQRPFPWRELTRRHGAGGAVSAGLRRAVISAAQRDAVCVCVGEVRTPDDPAQPEPDLVLDVAELIWEPIPGLRTGGKSHDWRVNGLQKRCFLAQSSTHAARHLLVARLAGICRMLMTDVRHHFNLRQPALVAHELSEANRRLAREEETPSSIVGLVEDVADAIAEGEKHELALVNPWIWIRVQGAALRAQAALRTEDPDRRRQLRLALEQMRFLFARIAEREPIGEDQPANDVVRWFEDALSSVAQPRKAGLLGVSVRTYQRSDLPIRACPQARMSVGFALCRVSSISCATASRAQEWSTGLSSRGPTRRCTASRGSRPFGAARPLLAAAAA